MNNFTKKRKKKKAKSSRKKKGTEGEQAEVNSNTGSNFTDSSSETNEETEKTTGVAEYAIMNESFHSNLDTSRNAFSGFSDVDETPQRRNNNTRNRTCNKSLPLPRLPKCTRFIFVQPSDTKVFFKRYNPFGLKKSLETIAGGAIKAE